MKEYIRGLNNSRSIVVWKKKNNKQGYGSLGDFKSILEKTLTSCSWSN